MAWNLVFVFLLTFISLTVGQGKDHSPDPDEFRTVPELIIDRGYGSEEHFVSTPDGYILGVHRIKNPLVKETGRPVLLWHGLESSSRDFIINDGRGHINDTSDPGNNLGFVLAKKGYDVWMGNTRGNTYSRNHTSLDPEEDKSFWDFTYDEMIAMDLPPVIDYILKETNRKDLAYIGHSQGTLVMFGLLATQPKYNDIIKPFIALAPVTSVDEASSPITHLAYIKPLLHIVRAIDGEFLPANPLIDFIAKHVCDSQAKDICSNLFFLISGFDQYQWNDTRVYVYTTGQPAGTSSKNVVHFAQNVRSGIFRKFDYGHLGNLKRYRSLHPPRYQLENITCKDIALYSSLNDWLATPKNVDRIRSGLRVKLMDDYMVPFKKWNHVDFILAMEAGKYINKRILDTLATYD